MCSIPHSIIHGRLTPKPVVGHRMEEILSPVFVKNGTDSRRTE